MGQHLGLSFLSKIAFLKAFGYSAGLCYRNSVAGLHGLNSMLPKGFRSFAGLHTQEQCAACTCNAHFNSSGGGTMKKMYRTHRCSHMRGGQEILAQAAAGGGSSKKN
eukprot:983813-Pelagomonas_calceolata.AAC.2